MIMLNLIVEVVYDNKEQDFLIATILSIYRIDKELTFLYRSLKIQI